MSRDEMLKQLKALDCRVFWPDSWDDIGFTEHQIWVNEKGYGYLACDEPNITYKAEPIATEKWQMIRSKIQEGTLSYSDIEGTSLSDMYFFEDDEAYSSEWLKGLLALPNEIANGFYCADSFDGPCFFGTEEEFLDFLKRDWCDVYWDELDDENLALRIDRLNEGALEWDV